MPPLALSTSLYIWNVLYENGSCGFYNIKFKSIKCVMDEVRVVVKCVMDEVRVVVKCVMDEVRVVVKW